MANAIFVPGLLCTGELYSAQVESLGGLDIAIGDHRSHESMGAIAGHILGSAPERFVLAGLSMGGYVAFEIMRQAPERIEALVLLDTSARPDAPEQTARRQELIDVAQTQGIDPLVDILLPVFLSEQHQANNDLTEAVRAMARETGVEAFVRQQQAIIHRADSHMTLRLIACPTLVIVGANDVLTPPDLAEEIAEGIPGAELCVIDDCGHLSAIEQPGAVNDAIASFLQSAGLTG